MAAAKREHEVIELLSEEEGEDQKVEKATPSKKRRAVQSEHAKGIPLAERMRPQSLADLVGQPSMTGDGVIAALLRKGTLPSLLLWGPPGCGKTTFADIAVRSVPGGLLRKVSAVSAGVKELREAVEAAKGAKRLSGAITVLFVDEIHRFSKAQQDALLPAVEQGLVTLLGATTENPSFSVNGALLSRCRVVPFQQLEPAAVRTVLSRAITTDPGMASLRLSFDEDALEFLATTSDGDARSALNALEISATTAPNNRLTLSHAKHTASKMHVLYDKKGDEHYNIISALHKSMRGSDPDAALYWLARMLEGGEDPRYIARRLIRFASEDVGLADPSSLSIASSAMHAVQSVGMPECDVNLAQAVAHLSLAPKSISVYSAYKRCKEAVKGDMAQPVPLHIRNAPHPLMKQLGFGEGYVYPPSSGFEQRPQAYLPDRLIGTQFLELTPADCNGTPGASLRGQGGGEGGPVGVVQGGGGGQE
eukprot:Hpha_TRINITY_DN35165_c0_g1::TRINITY_DN35165_c0_g1_i1::g.168465::m.168465/K07478/ycaJ; putative ATPase